jgi:muramoyltetrapeptide carboxypeptidase LdcA involved in peptidoglycan recycling
MKYPKRLKQGDKIGIAAPAGPVDKKNSKKRTRNTQKNGIFPRVREACSCSG